VHLHIFDKIFEKAFDTDALKEYQNFISTRNKGRSMYHFTEKNAIGFADWNGSQACFEKRFCDMSHDTMD